MRKINKVLRPLKFPNAMNAEWNQEQNQYRYKKNIHAPLLRDVSFKVLCKESKAPEHRTQKPPNLQFCFWTKTTIKINAVYFNYLACLFFDLDFAIFIAARKKL